MPDRAAITILISNNVSRPSKAVRLAEEAHRCSSTEKAVLTLVVDPGEEVRKHLITTVMCNVVALRDAIFLMSFVGT